MSKRPDQPVQVTEGVNGPTDFAWAARWMHINKVLDYWEEIGCWWRGEAPREVFRVLTAEGGTFELHRLAGREWRLYREYD